MDRDNSIAVSTRGLRKQFGGNGARVEALRGVDFQAKLGELTFIVGPSGCGKTTLLSVITGLLDPTAGEVGLFGEAIHRLPANHQIDFRRRNLGFVFQQYNLLPALTAAENAAVPSGSVQASVAGMEPGARPKLTQFDQSSALEVAACFGEPLESKVCQALLPVTCSGSPTLEVHRPLTWILEPSATAADGGGVAEKANHILIRELQQSASRLDHI